jgi:hypothetical protein
MNPYTRTQSSQQKQIMSRRTGLSWEERGRRERGRRERGRRGRTAIAKASDPLIELLLGERLGEGEEGDSESRGKVDLVGELHSRVVSEDSNLTVFRRQGSAKQKGWEEKSAQQFQ